MSAVPPAVRHVTERDLQTAVVALARTLGYDCLHVGDSRKQVRRGGRLMLVGDPDAAGLPDWLMVRGRRCVWLELKTERGKLRRAQEAWIERLRGAGQEVHVFRPSDFDSGRILDVLAGRSDG